MLAAENLVVLYIENDLDIRVRGSNFMRENGLKVFESSDTTSGCVLFRTNHIDIVIIDLELPEDSGYLFIHCLRDKNLQTPIITTTWHTSQNKLFEAINLDITQYLMKPYRYNELYESLERAIRKVADFRTLTYTMLNHGFSYDPVNKTIHSPDCSANQLSKKKYLFLELLLKNNKNIVPYDTIESIIWDGNAMSTEALRTLVRDLRIHSYPDIVSNHSGVGYKINV